MKKVYGTIVRSSIAWPLALIWLVPFVGVLMSSIRPFKELLGGWWVLREFTPGFENYTKALFGGMNRYLLNTILITIPTVVLSVIVSSMAAYAFSRYAFFSKNILFLCIIILQAIPQQMLLIPIFSLLRISRLLNTFLGIILVHTGFALPWIIFFLRNYLYTIPRDFEDAARVDGCNEIQAFFRIILPMCAPALASVSSIQLVWTWNDLLFSLVFLSSRKTQPIAVGLVNLKGNYFVDWGLLSASSVIAIFLPLLIYLFMQKYYMKGIVSGGIKG